MRFAHLFQSTCAFLAWPQDVLSVKTPQPTVTVKNGTYAGVYNKQYGQDHFLGVPFAQASLQTTASSHKINSCLAPREIFSSSRSKYFMERYPKSYQALRPLLWLRT